MEMQKTPPPQYSEHEMDHGPPGHFGPPQVAPVTVVAATTSIIPVGPSPANMVCPSCRATIVTRVENKSTTKTHIFALIICLFLCWPCVCVPYCTDSCMNAEHFCPNCNAFLGTYQR